MSNGVDPDTSQIFKRTDVPPIPAGKITLRVAGKVSPFPNRNTAGPPHILLNVIKAEKKILPFLTMLAVAVESDQSSDKAFLVFASDL